MSTKAVLIMLGGEPSRHEADAVKESVANHVMNEFNNVWVEKAEVVDVDTQTTLKIVSP